MQLIFVQDALRYFVRGVAFCGGTGTVTVHHYGSLDRGVMKHSC